MIDFYSNNLISKNIISKFLNKKNEKLGFYLFGDVGVGKTMILDFYYNHLSIKKNRMHFNEFMINFHDYRHQERTEGKNGNIDQFVNKLKDQFDLIYLDEFQVTNIVDAMILGKLFETIFEKGIKVIISSNIKIDDLYKDGLQRDQFLPFLEIIKKNCIQHELIINQDYRRSALSKLKFELTINGICFSYKISIKVTNLLCLSALSSLKIGNSSITINLLLFAIAM